LLYQLKVKLLLTNYSFNEILKREGESKSKVVIQLIEDYVKAHSEGNSKFKLDTWVGNSNFIAVPTNLEKNKQRWIDYVNSGNNDERRDLTISSNFVLKTMQNLEYKTETQLQNNKSYEADRLRNNFDIRNKDPSTLNPYQLEQLTGYQAS
jgi:hypothetical protein